MVVLILREFSERWMRSTRSACTTFQTCSANWANHRNTYAAGGLGLRWRRAFEKDGYQAILLRLIRQLKQKKYVSSVDLALAYAQLDDREKALSFLVGAIDNTLQSRSGPYRPGV